MENLNIYFSSDQVGIEIPMSLYFSSSIKLMPVPVPKNN